MNAKKFTDPHITAKGERRASVMLKSLDTLWFNTGTLCNFTCKNCYIESSPSNDQLSHLTLEDIKPFIEEIKSHNMPTQLIGLTGGEPFFNPHIMTITQYILEQGFSILILTNASRPLKLHQPALLLLKDKFRDRLHIRVSLDHYSEVHHDKERGKGNFNKTLKYLKWFSDHQFNISIASRSLAHETEIDSFSGHQKLLNAHQIKIDLKDKLVIFPEMKSEKDVPEISVGCWDILKKSPDQQMCASERMIVKRKGEAKPVIMPCTLLAYQDQFILGHQLASAHKEVPLNHRFCAEFCVLGGASCSTTK